MRIFIIRGAFGEVYEPSWCRALESLGHDVKLFDSHAYTSFGLLGRIERKFLFGIGIWRIRYNSIKEARRFKPDVILIYQGHYHNILSILRLKRIAWVTGYHNDNPFSAIADGRHSVRYKYLIEALPFYDSFHVYRDENINDLMNLGLTKVKLLRPSYVPWLDHKDYVYNTEFECDVIFAGHPEKDGREIFINSLLARNINIKIYGDRKYWLPLIEKRFHEKINIIRVLNTVEYRQALLAGKICLSFFSNWNRDVYTRRVFEVTAMGKFLMTPRTPSMEELFIDGDEIVMFNSLSDFNKKIDFYLNNINERDRVANNGYLRCTSSGYDLYSSMNLWINDILIWKKN